MFNESLLITFLLKTVKWRADNKMDTILEEDWSDFQSAEYRVSVEGCKDGRPRE